MKEITRAQMIKDLDKMTDHKAAVLKGKKGFAKEGGQRRLDIQVALYNRLIDGGKPSNREMAGIYGAGARFVEGK
jgi:hypothetical protein